MNKLYHVVARDIQIFPSRLVWVLRLLALAGMLVVCLPSYAGVYLTLYSTEKQPLQSYYPRIFTDENMADAATYKLRAKFNDGSQYGFHAATTVNNNNALLDQIPAIGSYSVSLYWVKIYADNSQVVGPETIVTVNITTYGTPAYYPDYWNNSLTIRNYNNCYNYACNKRTDTYAQPGRYGGLVWTAAVQGPGTGAQCRAAVVSAVQDWDHVGDPNTHQNTPTAGLSLIALACYPDSAYVGTWDYHFYRRDANGSWSHKTGQGSATNLDNGGQIITNPETCNRGPYTLFVGYYWVWEDVVQGVGSETIR